MVKVPKTKRIGGKTFRLVGTGVKGAMDNYAMLGADHCISTKVVKVDGDIYALYIRPYGGW